MHHTLGLGLSWTYFILSLPEKWMHQLLGKLRKEKKKTPMIHLYCTVFILPQKPFREMVWQMI